MKRDLRFAKLVVIVNALVPAAMLAWDSLNKRTGANPVTYALHTTGLLSFIFLLLSLLVTPLRKLTGWNAAIAFRRALGLTAFFYACAHFLIFFGFDRALSVGSTIHEILARRYLQIGTAGLLLMVPLAVTSTNGMVMRLGARRWKALHRSVYAVGIAAAVHYTLLVKSDVRQPLAFAAVLGVLLGYRIVSYAVDRRQASRAPGRPVHARTPPPPSSSGTALPRKPAYWSGELLVASVFDETPDVRTFRLMLAGGGELPFDHQPGQYLNLALTIGGKRVNRSYTIASSPTRATYVEVTVKRSASGHGSSFLHDQIRVGSKLKVSAPAGRFVFTGGGYDRVVLIAGGVGITPLMAIIRHLTDSSWGGEIHLIVSAKTQADLIFRDELTYLERRFPNLHVCVTLSREDPGSDWAGERGVVSAELLRRCAPELARSPVYLCGPDAMMAAMRKLLGELGVPAAQVKTEAFVSSARDTAADAGPAPVPGPTAADAILSTPSSVSSPPPPSSALEPVEAATAEASSLRLERSFLTVELLPEETILEAAERGGASIPFECRSGICGQCKTRLIAGVVTMETEDALSAAEKARGLILACQARSRTDVTVDA